MSLVLWSSPRCPYAHRTRALLHRLEVPYVLRNTSLWLKSPAFRAVSPTGKVPLLLDEDRVIPESAAIADHIVAKFGWTDGFPGPASAVARQRAAMVTWDETLLPRAYYAAIRGYPIGGRGARARAAVDQALDVLEAAVPTTPPDSVLGLHVATFWRRFQAIDFMVPAVRQIRARREVCEWLNQAGAHPAIAATAPDEARIRLEYRLQQGLPWLVMAGSVLYVALKAS